MAENNACLKTNTHLRHNDHTHSRTTICAYACFCIQTKLYLQEDVCHPGNVDCSYLDINIQLSDTAHIQGKNT